MSQNETNHAKPHSSQDISLNVKPRTIDFKLAVDYLGEGSISFVNATAGFMLAITISLPAFAVDLTEVALFHRCYAHLTGKFLPVSDPSNSIAPLGTPLKAQVRAGTKTAKAACLEILNQSLLNAQGTLITSNSDTQAVLRTFNDLHRSWFEVDDLTRVLIEGNRGTRFLVDEAEPGLFVTRSLFTAGVNYSEVVTQSSSMEGLRTGGAMSTPQSADFTDGIGKTDATYFNIGLQRPLQTASNAGQTYTQFSNYPFWSGQIVQQGDLVGVRLMTANATKLNMSGWEGYSGPREFTFNKQLKPNESLGGGVLGTKSYLTLNFGRPDNQTQDGGLRVARRWAKAVYKNLLCRELPVLRPGDSQSFVQPVGSGPGFRQSNSCMQCHASMDRMAYAIRNLSFAHTPYMSNDNSTTHIANWDTTLSTDLGFPTATNGDPNFYKTPTNGVIYFRDFRGDRKDIPTTNGTVGLGQQMSQLDDLYVCAASRYFSYFTGIEVKLRDPGNGGTPLTATQQAYLDQVITLGMELKSTQNLRTLIDHIISLPIYKRSSLR